MSFLDKNNVLVLNSIYQGIGMASCKKALITICSENGGQSAAKVIDLQYGLDKDDYWDFNNVVSFKVCDFEEWVETKFREGLDTPISTCKMQVKAPTVIITSYSKMPFKRFKPNKSRLYEMQGGRCGYSGVVLPMKRMNIEHVQARSHGGKDVFPNLMLVDEKINHKRGNRPLEELGLKPLFKHNEPKPIPVAHSIKGMHPDHAYFLIN